MSTCSPRTKKDLLEIAKAVSVVDRQQAARVLSDARNYKPGPIYWTWVNGLISGMLTHTKYLAANALYQVMNNGLVTPVAALVGVAKKAMGAGNDVDRVLFGESAAGMWGAAHAIPTALMTAAKAVKAGMKMPLDSERELYNAAVARRQEQIAAGEKPEAIDKRLERAMAPNPERPISGLAGRIIGAPGDAAQGIHTFFKILGERSSLSAQAYAKTAREGLSPTGDSAAFWQRVNEHAANPTDEMRGKAIDDAYKGTFMQELGPHGKFWSLATKKVPGLKWVFPFAHIPINIAKATYEATPLAFADGEMRSRILGQHGGVEQDKAIAKMVVGSSIMGYFALKYMNGQATGDYPVDPRDRDAWKLAGKEPNSILMGNYWVSFNKFGPAGDLANFGANIAHVLHTTASDDDHAIMKGLWEAAHFAGNFVGDEVGFESVAHLIDGLEDEKKGEAWLASQASSLIPFSSAISQTASVTDPQMREMKTFWDGLKYRFPGARETLMPKRDWSGQPIANPQYGNIIRKRQVDTDPVDREMSALGVRPTVPANNIAGVQLSPELYDRYQVMAGSMARSTLEGFVRHANWGEMPAVARANIIKSTISESRRMARSMILGNTSNGVLQQAMKSRMDSLTAGPKSLEQ